MPKATFEKKGFSPEVLPVTVAIIGAGYWGTNLIRNFFFTPGVKILFVCDTDAKKLEAVSRQYPSVVVTRNIGDVIKNPLVDAVVIATPVSEHHFLAREALRYGKHVLVEKPMASSVLECKELVLLAKRQKRVLSVDHTFLFSGAVRKIKELLDKGELGDLHYFDSERINLGLIQSDINVVWDLAPHDIAIMNYIFSGAKPKKVFATGTRHVQDRHHEIAHLAIYFDNGVVGHIHVSWISPVKIRKIVIGGSKKMILYDDIEPSEKIKIYDKGVSVSRTQKMVERSTGDVFLPVYRAGDVLIPKLDIDEPLKLVARNFAASIRGEEKPLVSGEDGLNVVRILEASDRSLLSGRIERI